MAVAARAIKAPQGHRWIRLKGARVGRRHLAVLGRRRPLCGSHQVGGVWVPTEDHALPTCGNCLAVHRSR